jgi:hypothetical protein
MQGILPVMPAIKESKTFQDDHLISIVPAIVEGSLISDKSKNSIENNAEIKRIDVNTNVAKEQKGLD